MNEHEHHQAPAPDGEPSSTKARAGSDLEDRRLDVSQEQLMRFDERATGEEGTPGAEVRTVSLDELPHGETNVSVVREGTRRYRQHFLAYLILDGIEQRSPDLIEQYEQRSLGSFPDRGRFAEWAIEDLGWSADLIELRALQGMWPEDVTWNVDALWPLLAERYAVTERLGGVHAFRR